MTYRRHSSIGKSIDSMDKNLFLLDYKTFMPERIGLLLGLSETTNTPGYGATVTLILPGCIGVITELPSLNCSNCIVNTS